MDRLYIKILIYFLVFIPYQGMGQVSSLDTGSLAMQPGIINEDHLSLQADSSMLEVPNVFTPNDDGLNDLFYVATDGNNIYNLRIYSRTGMLVYKSESKSIIWDGRLPGGEEVEQGIYYYTIESGAGDNSQLQQNGYFYLFK